MSFLSLLEKYRRAYERVATPRSSNFARVTVYTFPKYCRACNAGMTAPQQHLRRRMKELFRLGFCQETCFDRGPPAEHLFKRSAKSDASVFVGDGPLEELLDLAIAIDEKLKSKSKVERIVHMVDEKYSMLSEKLSALEMLTQQVWTSSKFYYFLRKQ